MNGRAVRRHHERRIKERWRQRIRRWWYVGTAELVERLAVRRAHRNKCDCWMCGTNLGRRPEPPWEREDAAAAADPEEDS
jgi:hypothetical protein